MPTSTIVTIGLTGARFKLFFKEYTDPGALRLSDAETMMFAYQAVAFNLALQKNVSKKGVFKDQGTQP